MTGRTAAAGRGTGPGDAAAVGRLTGGAIRPGGLELTDRALGMCTLPPGAVVVDVGCGAGISVQHLRTRHALAAFGIDPSAEAVAGGRARSAQLPLLRACADQLPVADGCADAVLVECVLSLLPELDPVLAEFARALRSGGQLVISDLYTRTRAGGSGPRQPLPPSCPPTTLDLHRLLGSLHANGFRTASWEDHTAALTRLAVQLIWDGAAGSPACSSGPGAPGYFLLLAEKVEADR